MFRKALYTKYFKFSQIISIQNNVKFIFTLSVNYSSTTPGINDSDINLLINKDYLKIDVINDKLCIKLSQHPIYGPIKDYKRLIKVLRHHGVPSNDIIELLPKNLVYKLEVSDEYWKLALDFLKSLGFSKANRLKALSVSPQLIDGDSASQISIINAMAMLRSFNISDQQSHLVLILNPLLLSTPASKVINMHQNLLKYFTKSEVQKLIIRSPTILTDNWDETEKKIFYSHISMGLSGKEIAQSAYFSHSLNQIIARHLFVDRAGLFKTMKLKTSKSTSVKSQGSSVDSLTKENPTASQIFNHSNETFVSKTCEMSLEEFDCFCKTLDEEIEMIELELELSIKRRSRQAKNQLVSVNNQDDDDSDDDEDYDDNDNYSDDEIDEERVN